MEALKLHFRKLGKGEPLVILHGLMGMLDNWQTPAKVLSEKFTVYLVDQRNHGHSPHSKVFSYHAMMEDLYLFMEDQSLPSAHFIGHSMGGKTVMKFAQHYPEMVDRLVVADIAPKAYPVHHQTILDALSAVDLESISRRSEAEEVMSQFGLESSVIQFLLKNLYWKEKGKLAFRFNLEAIKNNIEDIGESVYDRIYEGTTLFMRGEKSDYIQDNDLDDIHLTFPMASLVTIDNAGHWLHADQPEQFLIEVIKFLQQT